VDSAPESVDQRRISPLGSALDVVGSVATLVPWRHWADDVARHHSGCLVAV